MTYLGVDMSENLDFCCIQPLRYQGCFNIVLWWWTNDLSSLYLFFLVSKMEINNRNYLRVVMRLKWGKSCKVLKILPDTCNSLHYYFLSCYHLNYTYSQYSSIIYISFKQFGGVSFYDRMIFSFIFGSLILGVTWFIVIVLPPKDLCFIWYLLVEVLLIFGKFS